MKAVVEWVRGLPSVVKGLSLIGSGGLAGILIFVQATELPARVSAIEEAVIEARIPERVGAIETEIGTLAPAAEYLACRAARQDAGLDPRDCREKVRGMADYLKEFAQ